jgi:hypothetical protein
MRTTLDIDDDVLQAAKELARSQKKTAGKVLSEYFRRGLRAPEPIEPAGTPAAEGMVLKNGFYLLAGRGGRIVTNELIDRLLEEADLEDAGLLPK